MDYRISLTCVRDYSCAFRIHTGGWAHRQRVSTIGSTVWTLAEVSPKKLYDTREGGRGGEGKGVPAVLTHLVFLGDVVAQLVERRPPDPMDFMTGGSNPVRSTIQICESFSESNVVLTRYRCVPPPCGYAHIRTYAR